MNDIVQTEANRVNAQTVMSDFEYSMNNEMAEWARARDKRYPAYSMMAEAYWREVHGIEV
jgi:hypothetical protein